MDNQNKVKIGGTSKQLKIIVAVIVLIVVAAVVVLLLSKNNQGAQQPVPTTGQNETGTTTAIVEASTPVSSEDLTPVVVPNIEGAKVAVVGANPITKDNIVVTPTGKVTENTVLPMSDTAPKQTGFLVKEDLAPTVLKLSVGNNKFVPSEFTTKVGAPTTFAITGVDNFSHVIAFDDPSLSAIAVLVGPSQTKAITFNAPTTAGSYTFYCASPDHAARGEKGVMIVK